MKGANAEGADLRSLSRLLNARIWLTVATCLFVFAACSPFGSVQHVGLSGDANGTGGGIGGTGIVGVITDFGSVVVNGRHVEIGPNTLIRQDGERANADELRVGQVVEIQAVGRSSRSLSRVIDVRREVAGPITDTDLDKGRVAVMGQAIVLAQGAIADLDLEKGRMVSVSGFRLADRTIVATRIDSLLSATLVHLYGRYRVSDDQVEIDGVTIEGMAVSSYLVGREVFVKGFWRNGGLTPTELEVRPNAPFSGLKSTLSIAGFFDSYTNKVADVPVERAPDNLGNVKLSDGRAVSFGIFEGAWSSEQVALEVDTQFSISNVMDTPDRGDGDSGGAGDSDEYDDSDGSSSSDG